MTVEINFVSLESRLIDVFPVKWHIGKSSFSHGATMLRMVAMDGHLMLTSSSHTFALSARQLHTLTGNALLC